MDSSWVCLIMLGIAFVAWLGYRVYQSASEGKGAAVEKNACTLVNGIIDVLATIVLITMVIIPHETQTAMKKYDSAVKDGYKIYYNGQESSKEAVGITKKNISKYDIDYNKDSKTVRITKKNNDRNKFVFVPVTNY